MSVLVRSHLLGVTSMCDHGLNVQVEALKASGSLPKPQPPGTGTGNARELGNA